MDHTDNQVKKVASALTEQEKRSHMAKKDIAHGKFSAFVGRMATKHSNAKMMKKETFDPIVEQVSIYLLLVFLIAKTLIFSSNFIFLNL